MRYHVRIESEKGKQVSVSGNKYIDIDVYVGNRRIAALTLREHPSGYAALYDDDGQQVLARFSEEE